MAEVEEVKSNKIPEVSRETRKKIYNNTTVKVNKEPTMTAFGELSIRDVVSRVNEEGIKREDIVSLMKDNGQYILVYYK